MTRVHFAMQVGRRRVDRRICLVVSGPAPAEGALVLAPHRAVYDLKLSKSRGKRSDRDGARAHPL